MSKCRACLQEARGGNGKRESQASQQLQCRVMSAMIGEALDTVGTKGSEDL